MKYNPDIHHRRSIRLKDYDYSQAGAYFVTICTKDKECYFGNITGGKIELSPAGKIANSCLAEIPKHHNNVALDTFIVMPNHVHAIIFINNHQCRGVACSALCKNNATTRGVMYNAPTNHDIGSISPQQNSLPVIMRSCKSAVTRLCGQQSISFQWQRNYYEHIVRSEPELHKIREYIVNNPLNWETDENYKA